MTAATPTSSRAVSLRLRGRGGVKTVVIGIPEDPQGFPGALDVYMAGFIVHEAFHQFQAAHFGEIPWQREERYPILDREKTALAALEMRILMDAVSRAQAGALQEVEDLLRTFIAVRRERWRVGGEFVARHERDSKSGRERPNTFK